MKIVVGRASEFAPGEKRIIEAGNRSIGVYRIGDSFYALANSCPHQGGPLCLGRTKSWAYSSAPGEAALDEEATFVACPWHGWEYEISTGQSFLGPGEPPARGYGVNVTPGSDLGTATTAPTASAGPGQRTPGPYVADTFDVQVDEDYVVIDTSPRARPKIPAGAPATTPVTNSVATSVNTPVTTPAPTSGVSAT